MKQYVPNKLSEALRYHLPRLTINKIQNSIFIYLNYKMYKITIDNLLSGHRSTGTGILQGSLPSMYIHLVCV